MSETIAPENMSVAVGGRPFADPAQFGALVARIEGDIDALSRERYKLALARRKVIVICAAYGVLALCAQDALRSDLVHREASRRPTAVRRSMISPTSALRGATITTRVAAVATSNSL